MDESEKGSDAPAPRTTLKLKAAVARAPSTAPKPGLIKVSPAPRAGSRPAVGRSQDPSSWADEHKRRMQADMDALNFGGEAGDWRSKS